MIPAGWYAHSSFDNRVFKTAPSYIYAPVDAAVAYFLEVADASPIPVGIYNNPIRVGTDLLAEAIIRLAEHPNIVIDKKAMARPGQIANMAGQALRCGVEIVQQLGLAEKYGYRIREDLIGKDAAGAPNTRPAAVTPQTGPGGCFLR